MCALTKVSASLCLCVGTFEAIGHSPAAGSKGKQDSLRQASAAASAIQEHVRRQKAMAQSGASLLRQLLASAVVPAMHSAATSCLTWATSQHGALLKVCQHSHC